MVIMDIILLLSLAWCGREDGVVEVETYHFLRAGLDSEPCWRVMRMRIKLVLEKKKFSIKLKRWKDFGGETAGRARTINDRSPPAFDT